MSQSLAMQEAIGRLENEIEKVWELVSQGKKVRARIGADGKVLNPFSTLFISFELDGEVLTRVETLLKCDVLGPCRYCFTRNYSNLVLIKERLERVLETVWDGVLCWSGEPIFEENYFESIEVGKELIVGRTTGRMLVLRYRTLEVEWQGVLARVSVLEEDKVLRYFTDRLELRL